MWSRKCVHGRVANVIRVDETNHFAGAFLFHDRVMSQEYAKDVSIIDDTSCAKYFGLPILIAMSEYENGLSQVLTFSIMTSREKAKFVECLTGLKHRIGDIRLFVGDRHRTQVAAIKEI